jgi:hypothetical protein
MPLCRLSYPVEISDRIRHVRQLRKSNTRLRFSTPGFTTLLLVGTVSES